MQIVVDDFWWKELVRRTTAFKRDRANMSEYGVMLAVANIHIAATAMVDGASVFDEASGNHEPIVLPPSVKDLVSAPVSPAGEGGKRE